MDLDKQRDEYAQRDDAKEKIAALTKARDDLRDAGAEAVRRWGKALGQIAALKELLCDARSCMLSHGNVRAMCDQIDAAISGGKRTIDEARQHARDVIDRALDD